MVKEMQIKFSEIKFIEIIFEYLWVLICTLDLIQLMELPKNQSF